jgi:amino acid transporter
VLYEFNNDTGFDDTAYVVLIGMLFASFAFSGYESGASMAEETINPSVAAPKGIIMACVITIFIGLIYFWGLLFAINGNITAALSELSASGLSLHPVVNALTIAFTNENYTNKMLILILTFLLMFNIFLTGVSGMTVISRVGYALARDGVFPASPWLSKINSYFNTPINMLIVMFSANFLLLLLILINEQAFTAITSLSAIGYHLSYMIPILLRATVKRNTFK